MDKLNRVFVVIATVWSILVTAFVCLMGAAFSMTDRFNGNHTGVIAVISLLELLLLFGLYLAYRLSSWAVVMFLAWFAIAGAFLARPFTFSEWPGNILSLLIAMAPVTIVMILTAARWFASRSQ